MSYRDHANRHGYGGTDPALFGWEDTEGTGGGGGGPCPQNTASAYALAVLADSPRLYWQMQECDGNLADSSGNGFVGIWGGGGGAIYRSSTPLTPTNTYSIETSGGASYLTNTLPTAVVANCAVEFWIKHVPGTGIGTFQEIAYLGNGGANGWGCVMNPDRTLHLLLGGVGTQGASTALPDDTWVHVVLNRDATTWRVYLNGALNVSLGTASPNTPTGVFGTAGITIQRQTCHMALYDHALSATRIAAHYAAR